MPATFASTGRRQRYSHRDTQSTARTYVRDVCASGQQREWEIDGDEPHNTKGAQSLPDFVLSQAALCFKETR